MSKNRKNEFGVEKTKAIWNASRGRCSYCGKNLVKPDPAKEKDNEYLKSLFTVDHITPISKGGDNSLANMISSCRECNNARGNVDVNFLKFWLYRKKNPTLPKFNHQQYEWLTEHGIDIGKIVRYKFFFEKGK